MAERTLTMRILDSAALQQALARAGFSIARAFDESGQEVEPQARPGPTHAVRTYADRSAPRALTYWRRQAIRRPRRRLRSATEARAYRAYTGARRFWPH